MNINAYSFGSITIDGETYYNDVVIDRGEVRPRHKKPSRRHRDRFGHTPLSIEEDLPWSGSRLVSGTGAAGRLPIMVEVEAEAAARGIELVALPTAEACVLLREVDDAEVCAVLHLTC